MEQSDNNNDAESGSNDAGHLSAVYSSVRQALDVSYPAARSCCCDLLSWAGATGTRNPAPVGALSGVRASAAVFVVPIRGRQSIQRRLFSSSAVK